MSFASGSKGWVPLDSFLDALREQEDVEWIRVMGEAKMIGLDINALSRGDISYDTP